MGRKKIGTCENAVIAQIIHTPTFRGICYFLHFLQSIIFANSANSYFAFPANCIFANSANFIFAFFTK
jgi:hypothetical protein